MKKLIKIFIVVVVVTFALVVLWNYRGKIITAISNIGNTSSTVNSTYNDPEDVVTNSNGKVVGVINHNEDNVYTMTVTEKQARIAELKEKNADDNFINDNASYFTNNYVSENEDANIDTVADFLNSFYETAREKVSSKEENFLIVTQNHGYAYIKGLGEIQFVMYKTNSYYSLTDIFVNDEYEFRVALYNPHNAFDDEYHASYCEIFKSNEDLIQIALGTSEEVQYAKREFDVENDSDFIYSDFKETDYTSLFSITAKELNRLESISDVSASIVTERNAVRKTYRIDVEDCYYLTNFANLYCINNKDYNLYMYLGEAVNNYFIQVFQTAFKNMSLAGHDTNNFTLVNDYSLYHTDAFFTNNAFGDKWIQSKDKYSLVQKNFPHLITSNDYFDITLDDSISTNKEYNVGDLSILEKYVGKIPLDADLEYAYND